MYQVLRVGRSAFNEWLHQVPKREQEDLLRKEKIKETFSRSRNTYGHRCVKKELKKQGISSSNNWIRRLMKKLNLVPVQTRKYKATTNSKHSWPVAPNLLNKDFEADAPCRKWVGDISYLSTEEGWLYLATIIDLIGARRCLPCDTKWFLVSSSSRINAPSLVVTRQPWLRYPMARS